MLVILVRMLKLIFKLFFSIVMLLVSIQVNAECNIANNTSYEVIDSIDVSSTVNSTSLVHLNLQCNESTEFFIAIDNASRIVGDRIYTNVDGVYFTINVNGDSRSLSSTPTNIGMWMSDIPISLHIGGSPTTTSVDELKMPIFHVYNSTESFVYNPNRNVALQYLTCDFSNPIYIDLGNLNIRVKETPKFIIDLGADKCNRSLINQVRLDGTPGINKGFIVAPSSSNASSNGYDLVFYDVNNNELPANSDIEFSQFSDQLSLKFNLIENNTEKVAGPFSSVATFRLIYN